jgi:DNA-binding IclR family transcriptional regulator
MPREPIPDDLRRFILTSVPSVPFVEAMLLFLARTDAALSVDEIARRLYMPRAAAAQVIDALREAHIVAPDPQQGDACRFSPASPELEQMLRELAALYSRDLIGVTDLIHSRTARRAQQFADAFRIRKDS